MGATRSGDEVLTTAARLRTDGIRFVRVLHSDPYGRARSKELPVDAFPERARTGSATARRVSSRASMESP